MKKLVLCLVLTGLAVSMLMSGWMISAVQASDGPTDWAILIAGGESQGENYARFWNNIGEVYQILTNNYSYTADHIFVLYADGDSPHYMNCRDPRNVVLEYPTPGTPGINFLAATLDNLDIVTDTIAASFHDGDTLFVYTTDHGHVDGSLVLWGETILPATFASPGYIGKITQYSWRAFVMQQCHSGDFVEALSEPRTVIGTSCRYNESAYGHLEEDPDVSRYSEFSFHFLAALKGEDAYGNPVFGVDTNQDGKVSFREAFNYAQSNDYWVEGQFYINHPQYDDNGDGISHEGQMPAGGDGCVGSKVFLTGTHSPFADAGDDRMIHKTGALTPVTLDGSGSSDPDGDTLTYSWTWYAGGTQHAASGESPTVSLAPGTTFITLVVTDGSNTSCGDTVGITVYPMGGSGCPFLQTWDGNGYVDEGLLSIHNDEGTDMTFEHTLTTVPERVNGAYEFRLVEHPQTISYIDQVQMCAILVDGTIQKLPLRKAWHSEEGNVLNLLLKSDDRKAEEKGANYNGGTSQSIHLEFAALGPNMEPVAFVFTIEGINPNPYMKT